MKDKKKPGGERSSIVLESERNVDLAKLDLWREERAGIPEVVFGVGKRPGDVIMLLKTLAMKKGLTMATKASRSCLNMARPRSCPCSSPAHRGWWW